MKYDELKSFTAETFGDGKCEVYEAVEVDAAIAELKQKLEDAKATAYAESVDAGMRERRLKRALYKACANWAMAESYSELNDVLTANRWVHTLRKLETKLEEYK